LVQRQKKQRQVVANDTAKRAQSDMGMFWLSNPKLKMTKIFPRDLHEKDLHPVLLQGARMQGL
jgi:hypothetical protein